MRNWITAGSAVAIVLSVGIAPAAASAAGAASSTSVESGSAALDEPSTHGATEYVGGGIWTYYVGGGYVVSAYDHGRYTHSTTVRSANSQKSNRVGKGKVAFAKTPSTWWGGNRAYWNIF